MARGRSRPHARERSETTYFANQLQVNHKGFGDYARSLARSGPGHAGSGEFVGRLAVGDEDPGAS